ncbi:MAG TPA: hypothetical protein VFV93_05180 [Thermomicrobiales bacterium]|nr:hypothetical protein [Thermomicrobiales bacterium]
MAVYINSESELAQTLRKAAASGESIIIETDDAQYEIDIRVRWDAENADASDEPDAILELIGIVESREPSNIAEFKDQYIADAIDPRLR